MKERAIAMMAELDKVRFTVEHHPLLVKSIMELAVLCGTELQYPRAYGNGELGIVTTTADGGHGCRSYGEVFAGLMAGRRCRTGAIEYGYNAIMIPENGWCYMPYWEVCGRHTC